MSKPTKDQRWWMEKLLSGEYEYLNIQCWSMDLVSFSNGYTRLSVRPTSAMNAAEKGFIKQMGRGADYYLTPAGKEALEE